jgi:hypothetical protein
MNSAPENDTGRRRALVVGLSILIGVAGYWVANAIAKPSAPANVYGPKYGRDPDSQKIATSKAIPAKAGSGEAPLVGETQR